MKIIFLTHVLIFRLEFLYICSYFYLISYEKKKRWKVCLESYEHLEPHLFI